MARGGTCHLRPRIRGTTLRRRCLCVAGAIPSSARHSLVGLLAHRRSSIRQRIQNSHGRLSGWRICSRMRIRASLRDTSVVRDKISSLSGNTSKTRRAATCAVIDFMCASAFASVFTLRSLVFVHPLCIRLRPFVLHCMTRTFLFSSNPRTDVGMHIHSMCLYHYSSTKTQLSYRRTPTIMVYVYL